MRLRCSHNCTIYTRKCMFYLNTVVLLDLTAWWWLLMKDLMLLCRRVGNHHKSDVFLLIKAAWHEHVLLGRVSQHITICICRRCPQGWVVECFHLLAEERRGQPVWFCNGDLCAVLCHYSCAESKDGEVFVSTDFCNGEALILVWDCNGNGWVWAMAASCSRKDKAHNTHFQISSNLNVSLLQWGPDSPSWGHLRRFRKKFSSSFTDHSLICSWQIPLSFFSISPC